MSSEKRTSILMLISSMLIFGTIGIFRKYIPFSSGLLACSRGFLGAFSLTIYLIIRKVPIRTGISMRNLILLIISGALMGINWILLFEAYNYTSVAVATLCYYMEPTIVILLSPLLFKEKLFGKKLVCAIVSLIGMVLVSGIVETAGQGLALSNIRGVLFGLGSAAFYASVVILNKIIKVDNAYQKTIIQLLSAAVVLLPYLMITERGKSYEFSAVSVVMLLVLGLFHTGFAYALYFGSMKALEAQTIAVMSYIDPVSALILSALVLGERMSVIGIIGAVMIIGAALFSEIQVRGRKA